ncbi:MAG: S26 family signal peptidase [Rhizomicrobium sp.]
MRALQLLIATAASCALLACGGHKAPRLIWNATASAPIGFYLVVQASPLHRGDLVLAVPQSSVQRFAAQRDYLPMGVPLVKHIRALGGDNVCSRDDIVTINGHIAARRLTRDHLHRLLPAWTGCSMLSNSELLLLNEDVATSFDGRYFGPTATAAVMGKLVPLWTH